MPDAIPLQPPAFNLLDEDWIPIRFVDKRIAEIGLLELFDRAAEIRALAETSPPNLIALYRVLLAITHRALTTGFGEWKDRDRARWYSDSFPSSVVRAYLEQHRDRFWLFHPEAPFMQVAALATAVETRDKRKPWTQISLASACGATPVLFDHSTDSALTLITPAVACRMLLGCLQSTPGGLVKIVRDSDKAGPLANTAAVLPCGKTLNQTLCLALHPFSFSNDDLPAWERPPASIADLRAEPRLAAGPNDRYTRLTRSILLVSENDRQVRCLHYAAGLALLEDSLAPDPMASHRAGHNTFVRLSFREGRALWRDLPTLVPDASGTMSHAADVLGYAGNLHLERSNRSEQSLLVAGLASDQAKLLRWRLEQIELPAAFLMDAALGNELRARVRDAESLYADLRKIARGMYAAILPDHENKEAYARAAAVIDNGPAGSIFFAEAERALPQVLDLIARDEIDEACERWQQTLYHAAQKTWNALRQGLGVSARALRAEAQASPRFGKLLHDLQPASEERTLP